MNQSPPDLRTQVIENIQMMIKNNQHELAKYAYSRYIARLDWIQFPTFEAVRDALKQA